MSVRTLEYAVSINGISPANELFAGSQGDDKVTKISFNITALHERLGSENLYYRFDGYDAEGNELKGTPAELKNSNGIGLPNFVYYTLQKSLIRQGGRICVYLVITKKDGDNTEMEWYSCPARMRFDSLPQGGRVDEEEYESLTTLATNTQKYAESAEDAAERAVSAAENLSGDNIYIFDGGSDEDDTEVDFDFGFESTDTPTKDSPALFTSGGAYKLQEKIKGLLEGQNSLEKSLETKLDAEGVKSLIGDSNDSVIAELFGGLLNLIYPINTVITFHDNEDHSNYLSFVGFKWKPFASGRTLVGYNSGNELFNKIGKEDGEIEHTLRENEMPKHNHGLQYSKDGGKTWEEASEGNAMFGRAEDNGFLGEKYLGVTDRISSYNSWQAKTEEKGKSQPHNNMPPYIVTSFWIRTE